MSRTSFIALIFLLMVEMFLEGQGLLITETSRPRSHIPQSVGLFWTSSQPDAETYTCTTHNIHKEKISKPWGDSNPPSQQSSDRRPTP